MIYLLRGNSIFYTRRTSASLAFRIANLCVLLENHSRQRLIGPLVERTNAAKNLTAIKHELISAYITVPGWTRVNNPLLHLRACANDPPWPPPSNLSLTLIDVGATRGETQFHSFLINPFPLCPFLSVSWACGITAEKLVRNTRTPEEVGEREITRIFDNACYNQTSRLNDNFDSLFLIFLQYFQIFTRRPSDWKQILFNTSFVATSREGADSS